MRGIVRTFTYVDYELIAGEWEPVDAVEKEVVFECETLEEALEKLAEYREEASDYESYHIGYDDVTLKLEDWEEEWIELCKEQDREERISLIDKREELGLDVEDFYEEEWEDYDEEEFKAMFYED